MKSLSRSMALLGITLYAIFASTSIAAAQAGIILGLMGWLGAWRSKPGSGITNSGLEGPIILYISLAILSAFLDISVYRGLVSVRTYWSVSLVLLIPAMLSEKQFRTVFWCFVLFAGFGGSVYFLTRALYDSTDHFGWGIWFSPLWSKVTMGEAGRMVPLFGITIGMLVSQKRWIYRVSLVPVAAMILVNVVLNLKRGPWIGVIVSSLSVIFLLSRRRIYSVMFILFVMSIVVLIGLSVPYVRWRASNTLAEMYEPEKIPRFKMWIMAPDIMCEYPLGVGHGNAEIIQKERGGMSSHFHNNLVSIAVESGVLALIAWCWWMTAFFVLAWQTLRRLPEDSVFYRGVLIGSIAAMTGFLVSGMFEYNFGDSEIAMMMYFIMGSTVYIHKGIGQEHLDESTTYTEVKMAKIA